MLRITEKLDPPHNCVLVLLSSTCVGLMLASMDGVGSRVSNGV